MRKRVIVVVLALSALVGGVVWWSRAAAGREVTVRGRVTVDGEPVSGVLVIYYPDAKQGNNSPLEPRSRTNYRGEYQLQAEGAKGTASGWYRVAVVPGSSNRTRPSR